MSKFILYARTLVSIVGVIIIAACGGGSGGVSEPSDPAAANENPTVSNPGGNATVQLNHTPQIDGVPAASVQVGDNYEFIPLASDSDNDTLTFSIENQPSWLDFNPTSGALSGAPKFSHAG